MTTALLVGVLVLAAPGSASAAAPTGNWPGHPGRHVIGHVVQRGDTATGLAVRYHAWTDELLAINGLTPRSYLVVGERLRIPVVTARVRHHHRHHRPRVRHARPVRHHVRHHARPHRHLTHDQKMRRAGWRHWKYTRPHVRRIIVDEARRRHVDPLIALAVAWQESGWHQPLVSSDGAIGVMQVLPSTGEWMSQYAGKNLNLRGTHDNIRAGVTLLRVLDDNTRGVRRQVASYYQGLAGVQKHGLYDETRRYVRSVMAIRHRLARGLTP